MGEWSSFGLGIIWGPVVTYMILFRGTQMLHESSNLVCKCKIKCRSFPFPGVFFFFNLT